MWVGGEVNLVEFRNLPSNNSMIPKDIYTHGDFSLHAKKNGENLSIFTRQNRKGFRNYESSNKVPKTLLNLSMLYVLHSR